MLNLMLLSLNHQIKVVKDQRDDMNAKLDAEFQALEKEINGLGLEVSDSLLIVDIL